jgi:hypothetical protein
MVLVPELRVYTLGHSTRMGFFFFFFKIGLSNYLQLASKLEPPDLCLLSS